MYIAFVHRETNEMFSGYAKDGVPQWGKDNGKFFTVKESSLSHFILVMQERHPCLVPTYIREFVFVSVQDYDYQIQIQKRPNVKEPF